MVRSYKASLAVAAGLICLALGSQSARGDEPQTEGGWIRVKDESTGIILDTMEMSLHPKDEPRPALKYRLIPDEFDMLDGNAAVHYMKAAGFFEQNAARRALGDIYQRANMQASREGKGDLQVPPHSWYSMAPQDLPLEEVKQFLKLTDFQRRWIAEAARRRRCDFDRNLHDTKDPLAYLLPEVQSMRELARLQTVRSRVAIAEKRIDDAIEILGQQFALARHLGQDDFLVTNLVGFAISGIAFDEAVYLLQCEETPNLYWAFASLPPLMASIDHSLAMERQMFFLQFRALREVDETPRPAGYWQDFIDRLTPELDGLEKEFGLPWTGNEDDETRAALVAYIVLAYPGAKRYLIEECDLAPELVSTYPTAQAVFLAVVRYYERVRDDGFKWSFLPYWQAAAANGGPGFGYFDADRRTGMIAEPARGFVIALSGAHSAMAHQQQRVAMLQAVEAVRMYGARHGGELPRSLDDLPVPVPMEPFTCKPLDYEFHDDHAVLTGHKMPGFQRRLILRFAK